MRKKLNALDIMFFIVLAITITVSFVWHEGIGGCDSSTYTSIAQRVAKFFLGSLNYNVLFDTRPGAWGPYMIAIKITGAVGPYLTWVTMIEFLLLLGAIYSLLRKHEQVVGLYAATLLAFSPLLIRSSTTITGDIFLMLWVNLPLIIYWRCNKNQWNNASKWGMSAGICWVIAFYVKESAVLYLLIIGLWVIHSWRHRKSNASEWKFWKGFSIVLGITGVMTVTFFGLQTGDPLRKITLAQETVKYYDTGNVPIHVPYRWLIQPIIFFVKEYTFGMLIVLALPFFFTQPEESSEVFWKKYCIRVVGVWWLFPQSIDPPHPMWLIYRLWLPILVPLAICAGYGLKAVISKNENRWGKWSSLIAGTGSAVMCLGLWLFTTDDIHAERAIFYAILVLGLLLALFVSENSVIPNLRKVLIIMALIPFFWTHQEKIRWHKERTSEYEYNKEVLKFLGNRNAQTVLASYCLVEFHKLYNDGIHFQFYGDVSNPQDQNGAYLVIDKELSLLHELRDDQVFRELRGTQKDIETHPEKMGFRLVEETGRYLVYYHD